MREPEPESGRLSWKMAARQECTRIEPCGSFWAYGTGLGRRSATSSCLVAVPETGCPIHSYLPAAAVNLAFARVEVYFIDPQVVHAKGVEYVIAPLDQSLEVLLEHLGKALNGERTYIFEQNESGGDDNTYEWVADGVEPEKESLQNVPVSKFTS